MKKGRPREFDENHALHQALILFWRDGYEGVSINMACKKMGINVPSLYAAFGNKKNLFKLATQLYSQESSAFYAEAMNENDPRKMVEKIIDSEVIMATGKSTPKGSFMVQSALATGPDQEDVSKYLSQIRLEIKNKLANRFSEMAANDVLDSSINPDALANYVMAICSGLAIQAKSGVPRRKLNETAYMALKLFDAA